MCRIHNVAKAGSSYYADGVYIKNYVLVSLGPKFSVEIILFLS